MINPSIQNLNKPVNISEQVYTDLQTRSVKHNVGIDHLANQIIKHYLAVPEPLIPELEDSK